MTGTKRCVVCGRRTWPMLRGHIGRYSAKAPKPWPWSVDVAYVCMRHHREVGL